MSIPLARFLQPMIIVLNNQKNQIKNFFIIHFIYKRIKLKVGSKTELCSRNQIYMNFPNIINNSTTSIYSELRKKLGLSV